MKQKLIKKLIIGFVAMASCCAAQSFVGSNQALAMEISKVKKETSEIKEFATREGQKFYGILKNLVESEKNFEIDPDEYKSCLDSLFKNLIDIRSWLGKIMNYFGKEPTEGERFFLLENISSVIDLTRINLDKIAEMVANNLKSERGIKQTSRRNLYQNFWLKLCAKVKENLSYLQQDILTLCVNYGSKNNIYWSNYDQNNIHNGGKDFDKYADVYIRYMDFMHELEEVGNDKYRYEYIKNVYETGKIF